MGRHVIVNRLEIPNLSREAYNTTLRCQASNTKLAPPVERVVRLDMLCKFITYLHGTYFSGVDSKRTHIYAPDHSNPKIPLQLYCRIKQRIPVGASLRFFVLDVPSS